jgi:hypothetical protein
LEHGRWLRGRAACRIVITSWRARRLSCMMPGTGQERADGSLSLSLRAWWRRAPCCWTVRLPPHASLPRLKASSSPYHYSGAAAKTITRKLLASLTLLGSCCANHSLRNCRDESYRSDLWSVAHAEMPPTAARLILNLVSFRLGGALRDRPANPELGTCVPNGRRYGGDRAQACNTYRRLGW